MVTHQLTVINPSGLHARPASQLCQVSRQFRSRITLLFGHHRIDVKNVLEVMASGIKTGSVLTIACDGEDESAALDSILNYFQEFNHSN